MEQIGAEYVELRVEIGRGEVVKGLVERHLVVAADEISYFLQMRGFDNHGKVAHAPHGFQQTSGSERSLYV